MVGANNGRGHLFPAPNHPLACSSDGPPHPLEGTAASPSKAGRLLSRTSPSAVGQFTGIDVARGAAVVRRRARHGPGRRRGHDLRPNSAARTAHQAGRGLLSQPDVAGLLGVTADARADHAQQCRRATACRDSHPSEPRLSATARIRATVPCSWRPMSGRRSRAAPRLDATHRHTPGRKRK